LSRLLQAGKLLVEVSPLVLRHAVELNGSVHHFFNIHRRSARVSLRTLQSYLAHDAWGRACALLALLVAHHRRRAAVLGQAILAVRGVRRLESLAVSALGSTEGRLTSFLQPAGGVGHEIKAAFRGLHSGIALVEPLHLGLHAVEPVYVNFFFLRNLAIDLLHLAVDCLDEIYSGLRV